MKNLLVQEFLQSKSLTDLKDTHAVKHNLSGDGRKMSLNYDMIESKESDPLACQCRGLVLAKADGSVIDPMVPLGETVVLARPFDRFFNYGQGAAANVNFSDPETVFLEKLDGTLGIVYFDQFKNQWCVATRSIPDADRPVDGFGQHTYRTLFEKSLKDTLHANGSFLTQALLHETGELVPSTVFENFTRMLLWKDNTYLFEITTPINRVVVKYDDYRVTLLGVRETLTGTEFKEIHLDSVPAPKTYSFGSVSALLDFVGTQEPSAFEGVVVRDREFRRVKVKNPAYLAYNRIRDSVANSPRALMEVILLGKHDDVFPMLPQDIQVTGQDYLVGYRKLSAFYEGIYPDMETRAKASDNPRKTFALEVQERKLWMPPLINRFIGKCQSFQEFIDSNKKEGTWNDAFLDNLIDQALKP